MRRRLFLPVFVPLLLSPVVAAHVRAADAPSPAAPSSAPPAPASAGEAAPGMAADRPAGTPVGASTPTTSGIAPGATQFHADAGGIAAQAALPGTGAVNDYPTSARADYVFACMTVNGGSREALDRCSCSIDIIASILPYPRYEKAETVLSMRQGMIGGYLGGEFREADSNDMVRALREAQAEAEVRCF